MAKTGISRATLNNYISLGLLSKPVIRSGDEGERLLGYFPDESVSRVEEIKALKAEGLSMAQIAEEMGAAPQALEVGFAQASSLAGSYPAQGLRPALTENQGTSFPKTSNFIAPQNLTASAFETPSSGGAALRLSIDDISQPAYMFNYRFELVWHNEAARTQLLGGFDRLPAQSEDRHILPMFLSGLGRYPGTFGADMVRANLGLVKSRLSKDTVLTTCRQLPVDLQAQIAELYDEVPGAQVSHSAATVIPVDLPAAAASPQMHRLIATHFREGIFVVCAQAEDSGASLAEFLARRDLVIRHLLKKRLPVLTPLAVMVTDLQGSTRICSELPPEEYFELINEIWSSMEPIFRKYFGTHGKHVGDGMVYYFFPQPDSHYVFNAIRCAEEAKAEMRRISSKWQLRKGWFNELFLNTGLHEGTEWLGTFQTTTSVEFAVLGDTINQAARLSDFSRYGGVWSTKTMMGRLTAEEKSRVVYGVTRKSQDGRDVFVESTYAQIDSLTDLSRQEKLRDIATLPVTEIRSIK